MGNPLAIKKGQQQKSRDFHNWNATSKTLAVMQADIDVLEDVDFTTIEADIVTNASNLTVHQTSDDHDGRYYTETEIDAAEYISKGVSIGDSKTILLGASSDCSILHNGTNTFISNATGELRINNSANGEDIEFKCDDASGSTQTMLTLDPDNQTALVKALAVNEIIISTDTDAADAAGVSWMKMNTTSGNITIGGFANGVSGQILYVTKLVYSNTLTLEHNESTGTQKMIMFGATDSVLTGYAGATFVCNGTLWFQVT